MALFQKSVLKKYLKAQDQNKIDTAYALYAKYFHDKKRQKNIFNSKEEQFQEGFLRELFVNVLGYTLNPDPNFNLTTEFKNEIGAKKADGAILVNGKALAVIELKGMDTKDLSKVNKQAFEYKHNHSECLYVITSNFEKLRFFIDNSVFFEDFNLFKLSKDDFKLMWLCLSKENILLGTPLKAKKDSVIAEQSITKSLYKDYADFKNELWENICQNNPKYDKLLLFKKTQKLVDRFLFVFFAEDSGLLPPNSISRMVQRYNQLIDLDARKSLYEIFKQYFEYINKGRKGKTSMDDIFAYNGGLFLTDDVLDDISIDDELLKEHVIKLTSYDFESDIDVNILGHIFENSLNDIENVTARLEGKEISEGYTKRKKDGVYYTPKYITKYIVDNSLGKLCAERKSQIGIIDEEYFKGSKNRKKETLKTLDRKLSEYRNWLLTLTICDPACGSGAFLNQALEFLIDEHTFVDELSAQLFGASIVFKDVSNHILENNIYGVDVNEESVEIAKLSLWLRTAQRGRKLTSLNNNIKCGNSLINDSIIAGDKNFDWFEQFPKIFANGGFDIIIGNPPYVSNWTLSKSNRDMVKWLDFKFKDVLTGHWDLFVCFISLSLNILKDGGYNSFILPTSFLKEKYGKLMRQKIIDEFELQELVDFGEKIIFENVARQTFIYNIRKINNPMNEVVIKLGLSDSGTKVPQQFFKTLKNTSIKTNVTGNDILIYKKIISKSAKLGEYFCVNVGVVAHSKAGSPIQFKKDDVIYDKYQEGFKKYVTGPNLSRYSLIFRNQYIDYERNINFFHRPKFNALFESNKLIVRRTSGNNNTIIAYYDDEGYYTNDSIIHLVKWSDRILNYQKPDKKWEIKNNNEIDERFVQSLLCSKLTSYYFSKFLSTDTLQGAYSSIYPEDLRELPIVLTDRINEDALTQLSEKMQSLNIEYQSLKSNFLNLLMAKYSIEKLTKKMKKCFNLDSEDFLKEFEKLLKKVYKEKKIEFKKLSFSEEGRWLKYFNEEKVKALDIRSQIDSVNIEIDTYIYNLYDLSDEEVRVIESS